MWSMLIAYILIVILFYVEYRYESVRSTTMLQTAGNDQGTTSLLLIAWTLALFAGLIVPWTGLGGSFSVSTAGYVFTWIALGWIMGAILLLRWSIYSNTFYIRAIATTDDQFLCTDGPYKIIRHPGYLAFILAWWGFAVASGNWILTMLLGLGMTFVYIRRVLAEEQMMLERFGVDYQQYVEETFRLLPFVF
ncbi:hypothetical protein DM01DRAFT_1339629 [Hesseltinella vesiculosa]|uniref:Protein-S-isoprenylcysteine O-methyltransferase n=1 Tax=Hesseltinella vesiculosa TaxID=101127 RepID=A0A1X2G6G7_9FUNG|nr:hypothetical protein DM01DRAFT_1339629 [Hesseltinella vesiculosa]